MNITFCTIIETKSYYATASRLLDYGQMVEISEILAVSPEIGDIIPGTGGCRKMRYASIQGKGKSGGVRIIYYFLASDGEVYLLDIYAKNDKENITMQQRHEFAKFVKILKES